MLSCLYGLASNKKETGQHFYTKMVIHLQSYSIHFLLISAGLFSFLRQDTSFVLQRQALIYHVGVLAFYMNMMLSSDHGSP